MISAPSSIEDNMMGSFQQQTSAMDVTTSQNMNSARKPYRSGHKRGNTVVTTRATAARNVTLLNSQQERGGDLDLYT